LGEKCWNETSGFYSQNLDGPFVDASLLMLINSGFIDKSDPKAIRRLWTAFFTGAASLSKRKCSWTLAVFEDQIICLSLQIFAVYRAYSLMISSDADMIDSVS